MTSPVQSLVDDARQALGAAACSLAALDEEAGELTYVAASGAGADRIVGVRLPITRGVAGWVAVSGQPLAVSDLAGDRRFARDVAEGTDYVPDALLAVPVSGPDGVIGVLSILDRNTARPDADRDLQRAAEFAARAAEMLASPSGDELPGELRPIADLLRTADPERRAELRGALRRLLDELA
jgi:signal transduction protein with GAF and PtsI domain